MIAKKIACVIPARLQSSRFPKKLLATLLDRSILEWVWNAATKVKAFHEVLFAVDDQELADVIDTFGGRWVLTSKECQTGTDRIIEVMQRGVVSADIWVNWQGDEPFITESMIEQLLQSCQTNDADVWMLKKQIISVQELISRNVSKVIYDKNNFALYFSRSIIPCFRDEDDLQVAVEKGLHYKNIGLYAYTTQALQKIASMSYCELEDAEKLEMLRWLYHGLRIKMHETDREVMGIDTPEDLIRAHEHAKNGGLQKSHEVVKNNF